MRRRFNIIFLVVAIFLVTLSSFAQTRGIREEKPNIIGGEVGGRAFIYSINYERYFNNYIGVGLGGMGIGTKSGGFGLIPIYLSLNPVGNYHSLYLSAGAELGILGVEGMPRTWSKWLGIGQMGYQFQKKSGFVFRPTLTLLFDGNDFLAWPGLFFGAGF